MMSSAVTFQMKALGSSFQWSAQTVIAWMRSATELNTHSRRAAGTMIKKHPTKDCCF